MSRALIVIDIQNDYFVGGKYPQCNSDVVLGKTLNAIKKAQDLNIPVILIQHVTAGPSPFFEQNSVGVLLHSAILRAASNAPVITKQHADSFLNTNLQSVLAEHAITELLLCGMMTQNCVAHTALSKSAEAYKVTVLADCCGSVDEMVNAIALRALSDRFATVLSEEILN